MSVAVPAVKPAIGRLPARWLQGWAVLTLGIGLLAIASGGVVTTFQVGMADPIWPTYPWHLALISWKEPGPGILVEHTHRALDYTLGACAIVLAVGCWLCETRRWLRWLGTAALAAVICQGLIGGLRVVLNARGDGTALAFVHGCFAPLVFALLA